MAQKMPSGKSRNCEVKQGLLHRHAQFPYAAAPWPTIPPPRTSQLANVD
jgi:hypothetical protein